MPSIIGYSILAKKSDNQMGQEVLVKEFKDYLNRTEVRNKSNEEIANYLYCMSYQIVSKRGISLDDYYQAVTTLLDYEMIPFDCERIRSLLIHQLNQQLGSILSILRGRR